MSDDAGLAFFRITLLGMGDSGKTALTNVFVNNFCPLVYKETDDPELYYKKIKVEGNEDEGPFSVLVEIEDTYSSYRGDGESFGTFFSHLFQVSCQFPPLAFYGEVKTNRRCSKKSECVYGYVAE